MLARIKSSVGNSDVIRGGTMTLVIKAANAVSGFIMFALLARHLQPAEFGEFAMLFNGACFLAVVALCGQETLIVRSWDEYCNSGRPELARGVLLFGVKVILLACGAVLLVATAWLLLSGERMSPALAFAIAAFFLGFTVLQFSALFSRVTAGVAVGEIPREFVWRGLIIVAVLAYGGSGEHFGAEQFFWTAAAAIFAVIAFQAWHCWKVIPQAVKNSSSAYDLRKWIPLSVKMWLAALLDSSGQYLEIILVGLVLGPLLAALYFAMTRITAFFAMISAGVSIYASSRISALYYTSNKDDLREMLRTLALISVAFIVFGLFIISVGGQLMLAAFGPAYAANYPALLMLSVGAAIGALSGPAQHLLLLTGNEGAYPTIMAIGLALRFGLILSIGPIFGLYGVIAAWSASAIFISLSLIFVCRRLLDLDPSPLSVLMGGRVAAERLKGGVS